MDQDESEGFTGNEAFYTYFMERFFKRWHNARLHGVSPLRPCEPEACRIFSAAQSLTPWPMGCISRQFRPLVSFVSREMQSNHDCTAEQQNAAMVHNLITLCHTPIEDTLSADNTFLGATSIMKDDHPCNYTITWDKLPQIPECSSDGFAAQPSIGVATSHVPVPDTTPANRSQPKEMKDAPLRSYADVVREQEFKFNICGIAEGLRSLHKMNPPENSDLNIKPSTDGNITTENATQTGRTHVAVDSIRYYTHPNKTFSERSKQDDFDIPAANYSVAQNKDSKTETSKQSFFNGNNTVELWNQFSCSYPVIHVLDVMLSHLFHDWCNSMRKINSEQRIPGTKQLKKMIEIRPSDTASTNSEANVPRNEILISVEREVGFKWGKMINVMMAAHRAHACSEKLESGPISATDVEIPDLEAMVMNLARTVIIQD